jgi:hypothetical protein
MSTLESSHEQSIKGMTQSELTKIQYFEEWLYAIYLLGGNWNKVCNCEAINYESIDGEMKWIGPVVLEIFNKLCLGGNSKQLPNLEGCLPNMVCLKAALDYAWNMTKEIGGTSVALIDLPNID